MSIAGEIISIRCMTEADAAIFREVRLRSLKDAPMAFGSTHAVESARSDAEWVEKAKQRVEPGRACTFLAFDGTACCGVVSCFRSTEVEGQGTIVSMWVAPEVRRRGVGVKLIASAEEWARQQGLLQLSLDVTDNNGGAIALYQHCGFGFTGETDQYPNDPNRRELFMIKRL